ncbi:hypothetical protein RISK_003104 [Rhodopirellula islandica]|uniref:Uncharacterized protein n=1 Tax=Rhodopirellula islandica TaxID=595434 RepID=A0A0J1BE71_RHOIS|nr:hypothetical protein RISK_003104 [Rhodopirellula islandica]
MIQRRINPNNETQLEFPTGFFRSDGSFLSPAPQMRFRRLIRIAREGACIGGFNMLED